MSNIMNTFDNLLNEIDTKKNSKPVWRKPQVRKVSKPSSSARILMKLDAGEMIRVRYW